MRLDKVECECSQAAVRTSGFCIKGTGEVGRLDGSGCGKEALPGADGHPMSRRFRCRRL